MIELWNESLALINLPYTILLVVVVLYWGMVVAGAIGMDVLDGEIDLESDVDVDMELDAEGDIEADGGPGIDGGVGAFDSMMGFVNVGKVPLTIILSFFFLFLWMGGILANYYFNASHSMLLAIALFVPNYIVAIFLTKFATAPLVPIYRRLRAERMGDSADQLLGRECLIVAGTDGKNIGQAELTTERSTHRIYVREKDGLRIARGKTALIVDYLDAKNIYLVKAL